MVLFAEKDIYGVLFEGEGRAVGERALADNEAPVLEQFKGNFLYPRRAETGARPAASASGYIPCPMPCSARNSAGEEVIFLTSSESVASSDEVESAYLGVETAGIRIAEARAAPRVIVLRSPEVLEARLKQLDSTKRKPPTSDKGKGLESSSAPSKSPARKRIRLADSVACHEQAVLGNFLMLCLLL